MNSVKKQYLYVLALHGGVYAPLHGVGWVLPENVNFIIGEMYLGITCTSSKEKKKKRSSLKVWVEIFHI